MRQETARISLWKRTEAGIVGRLYLGMQMWNHFLTLRGHSRSYALII